MVDRLRSLVRRRFEEAPLAEPEESAFPPREFQPGYTPGAPPAAPPSMSPATQVSAAPDEQTAPSARPTTGDSIRILLKPVLLKLSDPLKARVRQPPGGPVQISIPLQKVLAQLPQGSVRISFGELRQASPAGVFSDASDQDQTSVELSLPEILAQLKPDQLARRNAQRKVEVPEDVSGIFGAKGQQLTP